MESAVVKESINVEDVCNLLNELLKDDAEFVHNFVSNRVDCNVKIACHPAVQVQENENGYRVAQVLLVSIQKEILSALKKTISILRYQRRE